MMRTIHVTIRGNQMIPDSSDAGREMDNLITQLSITIPSDWDASYAYRLRFRTSRQRMGEVYLSDRLTPDQSGAYLFPFPSGILVAGILQVQIEGVDQSTEKVMHTAIMALSVGESLTGDDQGIPPNYSGLIDQTMADMQTTFDQMTDTLAHMDETLDEMESTLVVAAENARQSAVSAEADAAKTAADRSAVEQAKSDVAADKAAVAVDRQAADESKAAAEAAKVAAEAAKTIAETHATNAGQRANAAKVSETNAEAAKDTAVSKAQEAYGSASAAANSAASASAGAAAAAGSKTAAEAAKYDAETAKLAAESAAQTAGQKASEANTAADAAETAAETVQMSFGEFEKMAVLIDDWNAVTENGIYMANGGANAPVSGEWHMGLVMHHNNAYSVQRVCAFASTKKWYERHKMNGSWDAWAEYEGAPGPPGPSGPNEVTTGTATNITGLLKGNGANVLAAEAGVDFATAGIADSGGAASTGYWVKYDDGTMICYKTSTQMPIINTQAGGMYRSSYISLGDFPQAFSALPRVIPVTYTNSNIYHWSTDAYGYSSSNAGQVAIFSPSQVTSVLMDIGYTAIGRWK